MTKGQDEDGSFERHETFILYSDEPGTQPVQFDTFPKATKAFNRAVRERPQFHYRVTGRLIQIEERQLLGT